MFCRRRFRRLCLVLFSISSFVLMVVYLVSSGSKYGETTGVLKYEESGSMVWTFDADSYIQRKVAMNESAYFRHAFNVHVSDSILVDRDLPDTRDPRCEEKEPKLFNARVSVVISFHNEARSALLRTVVSVLNRSPEYLLKEIILVDDYSDDASDGEELSVLPKVKILRNSKREGLIRSRALGADVATGDCIVFLDSHCEVNVDWLEPLVDDVLKNPYSLVSPVIDVIDQDSFEYKASSGDLRGGFDWNLNFHWLPLTESEKSRMGNSVTPFKSPVLAGGLLIARKSWFEHIGGFDRGLEIWGAESIELSLKTWMCGGQVLVEPCSRIGHVFRKRHPYTFPENASAAVYLRNVRRVAEIWLDEYQHEFFEAVPKAKREILTKLDEQIDLKRKLKCKPFQWFLQEVYPELRPFVKDVLAFGQIRQGDRCLQSSSKKSKNNSAFQLISCSVAQKQEWSFSRSGLLHLNNSCVTAEVSRTPQVILSRCADRPDQKWVRKRRLLVHQKSKLCLESSTSYQYPTLLVLSPCYRRSYTQQWDFSMELQVWDNR